MSQFSYRQIGVEWEWEWEVAKREIKLLRFAR